MAPFEPSNASSDQASRVLAVDDHVPFLTAMRRVVEAAPGFELAGEAESGEDALTFAAQYQPDVVLMDVKMPGLGGIEAARQIKASLPRTVVILVSATHPDELSTEAALCAADAIVWKPELRPAVLIRVCTAAGRTGDVGG